MVVFGVSGVSAQILDIPDGFLSPPNYYARDRKDGRILRVDDYESFLIRPFEFYKAKGKLFFGLPDKHGGGIIDESKIKLMPDGFFYYPYEPTKSNMVLVYGGDLLMYYSITNDNGWYSSLWPVLGDGGFQAKPGSIDLLNRFEYLYDGIKAVKASSSLREKTSGQEFIYGPERVKNPFFVFWDGGLGYNSMKRCWAEGAEGAGLGESLEVTLDSPSSSLMVLNGYVDFGKRYLYKANNRVRELQVSSESPKFSFIVSIPDYVHLHEIKLPVPASRLILKIVSVYPGERYNDTCISAVYVKQPEFFGTESYFKAIEEINKYLHKEGIGGF